MSAYEDCMSATNTRDAPWFILPADDKENARLIASQIVLNTLRDLDPQFPETSLERREQLQAIRKKLAKDIRGVRPFTLLPRYEVDAGQFFQHHLVGSFKISGVLRFQGKLDRVRRSSK
jgi:hypothetical protein